MKKNETKKEITIKSLRSDNDVVDGIVDEFDKIPVNPMMAKPMAVAIEIFRNIVRVNFWLMLF